MKKGFRQRGGYFDHKAKAIRIKELESEINDPDFWKDPQRAKSISQEYQSLKEEHAQWEKLERSSRELHDFVMLAKKEKDESIEPEVTEKFSQLEKNFSELEFFVLFSGTYDKNHAMVAIHAGAGGVEAQDWAEMLLRMILRYCEKRGFETKIIDESRGQEAGIKSIVAEVNGNYAYGYLKSESGVHRLVRISPFDAEKMRHTSFALVEVLPQITSEFEVKIRDEDLRIDVFRSGGHGGQSVNTTDSAVRVTHLPTGIVVKCQNERSQAQNKETATRYLKAKLLKLEEEKHQKELSQIRGEYHSAEWGNQIRSYVLQPYKMVKDHRTEYEEQEPQSVLDGNLEGFAEAYLKWINKKNN